MRKKYKNLLRNVRKQTKGISLYRKMKKQHHTKAQPNQMSQKENQINFSNQPKLLRMKNVKNRRLNRKLKRNLKTKRNLRRQKPHPQKIKWRQKSLRRNRQTQRLRMLLSAGYFRLKRQRNTYQTTWSCKNYLSSRFNTTIYLTSFKKKKALIPWSSMTSNTHI